MPRASDSRVGGAEITNFRNRILHENEEGRMRLIVRFRPVSGLEKKFADLYSQKEKQAKKKIMNKWLPMSCTKV